MKKKLLAAAGLIGVLVLAGCAGGTNSETEQLKQQIAQLEQQVTELENSSAADTADDAANASVDDAAEASTGAAADTSTDTSTDAAADTSADQTAEASTGAADTAAAGNTSAVTTPTFEELTEKVEAYVAKVDEDAASSAQKTLENYFTLKQEEDAIDRELEYYEDDLEFQYRNGSLTRDEYRLKERELDLLEDKLDAAEDTLEFVYGIDD